MNQLATTIPFPIGHNRLDYLKRQIIAGHDLVIKGGKDWVEGSLQVAAALFEGRELVPADIGFKDWLKQNELDFYNKNDRAALIGFASDIELARKVFSTAKTHSYDLLWRENRDRFPSARKPSSNSLAKKPKRRHSKNRWGHHRAMKLGERTIERIKDTSLDSSKEIDELIVLNRGAEPGTLTPTVEQLVAEAEAGKSVSALALAASLNKRQKQRPSLQAAWKKRMTFVWQQATYQEREAFIEYLMENLREDTKKGSTE